MLGPENVTCEANPGDILAYWDVQLPICEGDYVISKIPLHVLLRTNYTARNVKNANKPVLRLHGLST